MIQLEGIPNLSGLVQSFDQQQLANFCRILSVTISEPDIGNDDKHTLLAKNAQQKRNASPSRAEVNQGRLGFMYRCQIGLEKKKKKNPDWFLICVRFTVTLLNIPGFIERLCKLATRKVSEATGANFLQELEDWYTWLDNALVLDALMQMATEEAEQSSTGEILDIFGKVWIFFYLFFYPIYYFVLQLQFSPSRMSFLCLLLIFVAPFSKS